MHRFLRKSASLVLAPIAAAACMSIGMPCAHATTKGLNQIVTPDIQPTGALSLSAQCQDPNVGNRLELQSELGITSNFEIAVFEGDSPAEQIGNAELGLLNRGRYLLSTGFLNWSTKGTAPQPFLEGGYYKGNSEYVAGAENVIAQENGANGAIRNVRSTQSVLGFAYRPIPTLQVQADYQSGATNFATAGFTYSVTPNLTFNPAIYIGNSTPTKGFGYAVLTWTIQAFKPNSSPTPAAAPAKSATQVETPVSSAPQPAKT
jgi:hypothetical protein